MDGNKQRGENLEKENPNETKGQQEMKQKEKKPSENEVLKEKLKQAEDEAYDWKNKYYMVLADMQNLRKSLEEDHRNAIRYRSEGFLENLLPALDALYMALSATPNSQEAKNYQQGFIYIYNQLQNALSSEGVLEIVPKVGDLFDPNVMNAVDVAEGTAENDGKIAQVFSKGYKLHDKLIRPVNVKVYKQKVETAPEEAKEEVPNEANKA